MTKTAVPEMPSTSVITSTSANDTLFGEPEVYFRQHQHRHARLSITLVGAGTDARSQQALSHGPSSTNSMVTSTNS